MFGPSKKYKNMHENEPKYIKILRKNFLFPE